MLRARSIAEEHLYMRLHPCTCGQRVDLASLGHATAIADDVHVISSFSGQCAACGNALRFDFMIPDDSPKGGAKFGGDAPSTIIDPGEFYIASDEFIAKGDLERAIACLEEVLKFIPAGEDNVPSACFRAAAGAQLKLASPGRFASYRIEARIAAYRAEQQKVAKEPAWKRTSADAGYELCPSCLGRGWCKWCAGSGKPLGPSSNSCDGCIGKRRCELCEGEGQLVADHYAFGVWNKPATHPPRNVEDQALNEKMSATKAKQMQRRAEQGPRPPLPADSPIFKKWEKDGFLGDGVSVLPKPEGDVAFHLKRLATGDARARAYVLRSLAARPIADENLLVACERLLDDRTITLLGIPYNYGELRWGAADAVAVIRGALGRKDPVVIDDAFAPMSGSEIGQLAEQAGIPTSTKPGVEGAIETLEIIAAAGRLPRCRTTREPTLHVGAAISSRE